MAIFYVDSGSFKSITVTGSINISNGGTIQGTASYATTASYALNAGTTVSTASLLITASVSSNTITFTKGNGSTFPITVATGSNSAAFPYTGSAGISGSLNINGTTTINGPWNNNFTNGLHLAFNNSSNVGNIYSLQNGSAWRRLDIDGDPIVLGSNSAGKVGIGTDSPQVPLDIAGGAGARLLVYGTTGTPQYLAGLGVNMGQASNSQGFFIGQNSAFSIDQASVYENFPYLSGYTTRFAVMPGGNVGIGTVSPQARIAVIHDADTLVASFEGVNGRPFHIRTTDEPPTAGYDSPIGSICNNGVSLWLKTGSLDGEWAPIVYEKGPMPQSTHTAIDLSIGNYTIPGAGIYEITNASSYSLIFPDPAVFDGQRITIINTDNSNTAAIDNTNTFAPYDKGKTTQFSLINTEGMSEMVSINGKWRGFIA